MKFTVCRHELEDTNKNVLQKIMEMDNLNAASKQNTHTTVQIIDGLCKLSKLMHQLKRSGDQQIRSQQCSGNKNV